MMSSASESGTSTPESSRQVTNGSHLGVAETENTHRSISPAADALSLLDESAVISESQPEHSLPSNHSSATDLGHRESHIATSTPIAQRFSDVKHDINRASHLNMPEGQDGSNAYPAFNNDNPGAVAADSSDTDSAMQHSSEQLRKTSASQRNRSGSNSGSVSANDSPVTYNSIGSGLVSESSDVEGECSLMSSFTQTYSDLHEVIKVPIVGFEVMEERARFTVFKIHVKISPQENWFVFRRYTDFVRLNEKLSGLFPHFRLALPPKRWFGDNYDKNFLEDRQLGLQAFLTNVTCHKDVCISKPVREFFCLNDPPGRHDTLEESKALCESLEEDTYHLQQEVEDRDRRINLLEQELELQRMEITNLKKALKSEKLGKRSSSSHSISSSTEHLTEADQQRYNGVKMRDSKEGSPFKKSVTKEKFQAEMNSPNRLSIIEISEECSSTESTSAVMTMAPTPTM